MMTNVEIYIFFPLCILSESIDVTLVHGKDFVINKANDFYFQLFGRIASAYHEQI